MLLLLHTCSSSVTHTQNGNARKLPRYRIDDLVCSIHQWETTNDTMIDHQVIDGGFLAEEETVLE